ncbi:flagellar biosynthesis protein flip [Bacillus cereus]|nr:flagellar biosynthesis protein flip [Bacillus cereus]
MIMKMSKYRIITLLVAIFALFLFGQETYAETVPSVQSASNSLNDGFIDIKIGSEEKGGDPVVKMLLMVFLMSIGPSLVIMFTHFTYVVIVLSMTRQALGTMNIPPNQVLIGLAIFISAYIMFPVLNQVYKEAWIPLEKNKIETVEALKIAEKPLKKYMLDNTYEKDLSMMMKIRGDKKPTSYKDVSILAAVPAFSLTQIQKGLFTGMMIYWTFIFIDMIIGGLLMYMGMMMLPPMIISLPIKILIFIYLGGYSKITEIIFKTVQVSS